MVLKCVLGVSWVFCLVPALGFGQLKSQEKSPVDISKALVTDEAPRQGVVGLLGLDPSRFSMHQSFSMSYFSLGGRGYTQGLYLNTMRYRFSDPLSLTVQLGMLYQPFGGFGARSALNNRFFLSGARLDYQPSRNVALRLQMDSGLYGSYSPYPNYSPWWYGR